MISLRRLSGYQGLAAGFAMPDGKHVVVLAEDAGVLAAVFDRIKALPGEKFDPRKTQKAIIVTNEIQKQ